MKNIQFTSRRTDYNVLAFATVIGTFAIAGFFIGVFISMPFSLTNAAISVGSAIFAWSVFRFIRPVRYDRNWQIAEFMLVPAFWLLLTLALDVWLVSNATNWLVEVQEILR